MSVARLTMFDVAKFTLPRVGSIVLERHSTFGGPAHLHWGDQGVEPGARRQTGRRPAVGTTGCYPEGIAADRRFQIDVSQTRQRGLSNMGSGEQWNAKPS